MEDKKFAIIENGRVTNIVAAESLNVLSLFFDLSSSNIVECTEATGEAFLDTEYRNQKFVPFKYYDSWIFDESSWSWISPVPMPEIPDGKHVQWNEDAVAWELYDIPNQN